jgi:hypothetical protein
MSRMVDGAELAAKKRLFSIKIFTGLNNMPTFYMIFIFKKYWVLSDQNPNLKHVSPSNNMLDTHLHFSLSRRSFELHFAEEHDDFPSAHSLFFNLIRN